MSGLANKVAIVTGSSSGFGGGIALAHAAQGIRIIICADTKPTARADILEETEIPTPDSISREIWRKSSNIRKDRCTRC